MRWLILVIFILGYYAKAMELTVSNSEKGSSAFLIANGQIGPQDAAALAKILNVRAEQGKRTAILFTSEGGALEVIPAVGDAILKASDTLLKKHKTSNVFAVNEECSSACSVLTAYLTSKRDSKALEIIIAPDAIFGIHGPKGGDEKQNKQIAAYMSYGVSTAWLEKHDSHLRNTKMTDLKAEVLCRERSMVIPIDSCQPKGAGDLVQSLESRLGIIHYGP